MKIFNLEFKINTGQSLVELLVAIGLTAILLPALITGLVNSREGKPQMAQRVKAVALMRETQEAVRSIRNRDWSNIAINGTYHTLLSGNMWASASGAITENGFTRSYTVSSINRDSAGALVPTPTGTVDPSSKKIDILISWTQPYASSIASTLYLTRWRDNLPYTETTEAQFNAGTNTGTTVQASSPEEVADDGEIILGSGGHSNWCEPSLSTNTLDLPKNGVGKAVASIVGQAAAGTGDNSSGVSYANIVISDTYPPVPTIEATFDGYKTNGVFTEQDYAYLATDTNSKEVVIVDLNSITAGKYAEAGYFDAPGNGNANSVATLGTVGYMTGGSELRTFNLSSKAGSRAQLGSVTLAGTGGKVVVQATGANTYAYVTTGSSSREMEIVDVTNPASMSIVGYADLNSSTARAITVNSTSTRAFIATNNSNSQSELFIVDVSSKSGSRPTLGSYDSSGMTPNGVALVPGNRAIIAGVNAEEYQVVNISSETSPARCGGLQINVALNGVSSILEPDNDAYSYVIGDADPEFRIVEGGPGGGYSNQGTFESQTFNPGYQTADNRFEANFNQPDGTSIQFQVSLANLETGNCPSTYTFVGPDGTSGTWFPLTPTPGASNYTAPFPFGTYGTNYSNPGQCFRYKVNMTTGDTSQTPVLYDFTINYSP